MKYYCIVKTTAAFQGDPEPLKQEVMNALTKEEAEKEADQLNHVNFDPLVWYEVRFDFAIPDEEENK